MAGGSKVSRIDDGNRVSERLDCEIPGTGGQRLSEVEKSCKEQPDDNV